jgi:uncharacterized membrane protein YedE/YeeE
MKVLAALIAGLLFGLGLSLGGMTDPAVVLGFLDIFGHWSAQLAFVMGAAVLTTALGYRLVLRRAGPLLEPTFQLPTARRLDARLIIGAALFGIGWGLAGYCRCWLRSVAARRRCCFCLSACSRAGGWPRGCRAPGAKCRAHRGERDATP